jgi:hypothetical protein
LSKLKVIKKLKSPLKKNPKTKSSVIYENSHYILVLKVENSGKRFKDMKEVLTQKEKLIQKLKKRKSKQLVFIFKALKIDKKCSTKLKKIEHTVANKVDRLIKDVRKSFLNFSHKKRNKCISKQSSHTRQISRSRLDNSTFQNLLLTPQQFDQSMTQNIFKTPTSTRNSV